MKTIWKFDLPIEDLPVIKMPDGAEVLSAQLQGFPEQRRPEEFIQIWAEVDSLAPLVDRRFAIYGTGHALRTMRQRYVGTVLTAGGALVRHVYEVVPVGKVTVSR